jgi:hypothetical protein
MNAAADRLHQLVAEVGIGPEVAEPAFGDHRDSALVDPARGHAAVGRLDDDRDAFGLEHLVDRLRDLVGQPLLKLEAAGVGVDQS